ncbi:MAG: GerMN domain-containing protein [Clostridiales bacterium]|nr:GerMN domain-containing protein [Clostridiales bacterium]
MKKQLWLLLALFVCLLTACQAGHSGSLPSSGEVQVYFAVWDAATAQLAVGAERRTLPGGTAPVEALADLLLEGPFSDTLASPIPADVILRDWSLREGILRLNFSEQYGGLSGIDLTIADYCITLTMSQLPGVSTILISVEGKLIPFRHHQSLLASDVLLSVSGEQDVSPARAP